MSCSVVTAGLVRISGMETTVPVFAASSVFWAALMSKPMPDGTLTDLVCRLVVYGVDGFRMNQLVQAREIHIGTRGQRVVHRHRTVLRH